MDRDDFASSARAAEDRTRWKQTVVKSSVPGVPKTSQGYRIDWTRFLRHPLPPPTPHHTLDFDLVFTSNNNNYM